MNNKEKKLNVKYYIDRTKHRNSLFALFVFVFVFVFVFAHFFLKKHTNVCSL